MLKRCLCHANTSIAQASLRTWSGIQPRRAHTRATFVSCDAQHHQGDGTRSAGCKPAISWHQAGIAVICRPNFGYAERTGAVPNHRLQLRLQGARCTPNHRPQLAKGSGGQQGKAVPNQRLQLSQQSSALTTGNSLRPRVSSMTHLRNTRGGRHNSSNASAAVCRGSECCGRSVSAQHRVASNAAAATRQLGTKCSG